MYGVGYIQAPERIAGEGQPLYGFYCAGRYIVGHTKFVPHARAWHWGTPPHYMLGSSGSVWMIPGTWRS